MSVFKVRLIRSKFILYMNSKNKNNPVIKEIHIYTEVSIVYSFVWTSLGMSGYMMVTK